MIENYIKEADRVTYLMPKEVDHHCAGQIIAELDALIEGCGVRKRVFDMKQTEFMDSSGIAVALRGWQRMRELGGAVTLRHVALQPRKVFEAAGIGRMMTIA